MKIFKKTIMSMGFSLLSTCGNDYNHSLKSMKTTEKVIYEGIPEFRTVNFVGCHVTDAHQIQRKEYEL